ncbi:MAG: OmpA family protein [Marinilabiliaceae bacterium]|nr:OmpA family protein [Marinilabiliaceae bacterium]
MRKHIFFYLLLISVLCCLAACAGKERLGGAKKVYNIGEYHRSIKAFDKSFKKEKNKYYKGEAAYYMGDAYRAINRPDKAANMYARAMKEGYPERKAILYQAQSLLKLGKYEEAETLFEEYLTLVFGDKAANSGLLSVRLGQNPPEPDNYEIINIRKLNSKFSDYSPMLAPDDPHIIYFSSMRRTGKKNKNINKITGQGASVIYVAYEAARHDWKDIEPIFEVVETEEPTSETIEDGTISFTADGKEAFFTRTRYDKTGPMGAEIWNTKLVGGKWSDPSKISIGEDSIVFAHPSISHDGNTLYFTSDLQGGFGGNDIWKLIKVSDGWSPPINLGPDINTHGDEMFPYIHEDGTLYFSSDGLVGFGGLDIFKATHIEDEKWEVKNMGLPINSFSDDFGITFFPNREAGFFTSARNNTKGVDNIYYFERPVIQVVLSGKIDSGTDTPAPPNTIARIIGTNGTNQRLEIESSGTFNVLLDIDVEYLILVTAPGHFNSKDKINTKGVRESRHYTLNINLQSVERPLIFDNLIFESGKSELSRNTKAELDKVVAILNDNPFVKVDIISHTDAVGNENQHAELSKKRADVVKQYLISKEIAGERISAIGLGSEQPFQVDKNTAHKYNFLKNGDILTEDFIKKLIRKDQTTARNLNNRVEFAIRKE